MPSNPSRPWLRLPSLLLLSFLVLCAALPAQERLAFRARKLIPGAGAVVDDALMLVVDGRIEAISSGGSVPSAYRLIDLGDGVIAAGLVDAISMATAPNDLGESTDAVDLRSQVAEVLVAGHRDLGLLRASGITSVLILPTDSTLISGFGCVVKTTDELDFVSRTGPIACGLGRGVVSDRRLPTSFMGAVKLLRETLAAADAPALKEWRAGKRPLYCRADDELQLRGALEIMAELSARLVLVTDGSLRRVLELAKGRALDLVLPAPSLEMPLRDLRLAGEAVAAGHHVAFRADTPSRSPEALRVGAALAVRHGMSPSAAWAAISSEPARLAGVAERIGSLAVGRDADFIVLDGDPIDLSASLRQTYVGGKVVYSRPVAKEKADS
ncbi:MAG: amidohydrolase family protein [Planctomycetes bacterium]|nr:amidohydrolase family protein [Planctomycetota bacterium]